MTLLDPHYDDKQCALSLRVRRFSGEGRLMEEEKEGEPWGEESPGRGYTSYLASDLATAMRSYVLL
jgi:hypothetical protein